MDLGINGKTALVLGAGGGLGSAISQCLAKEGVNVALADINLEAANSARSLLPENASSMCLKWDLANLEAIESNVAQIEQELGSVDILVNNTGGPPPSPIANQSIELWQTWYETMVLPVIAITDRILPGMKQKQWGRIVTSTSSGVIAPIPNLGLSNTLRSALLGWSKTLASEIGSDGITSNIVLPGRISTSRILFLDEKKAEREGRQVDDVRKESLSSIPAGRYGEPNEYGQVVTFIASQAASYINGSVIRIDGGYISSI
ncbi:MAG: SDR family oxidoreductase [Rhizobiaceae bacterium]